MRTPTPGLGLFLSTAALSLLTTPAHATFGDTPGVRALGMGGALRAAATGDAGPALNPSGMALVHTYVAEAAYQYARLDAAHTTHFSIVDSTSASTIAGGLYYTYLTATPGPGVKRSGHEAGVSLALPMGERFSLGGTMKYASATAASGQDTKGFTFDAGATLRPASMLSFGVVGYNLKNLQDPRFAQAVGGGLALNPVSDFLVAVDIVQELSTPPAGRDKAFSLMAGAEYVFAKAASLRAGGGRDGWRQSEYVSGGLSLLSEIGALDISVGHDLSGSRQETFLGVSARLFVPSP